VRALTRKLVRDLWHMRGQVLAIALVQMAGVAMFAAYFSTFDSLWRTRAAYYDTYRFADLFASARRVPLSLVPEIAGIDGVAQVDVRVVVDVTLDLEGVTEPATGRLVSMTFPRERPLNDVFLRRGRDPDPRRPDEAIVSEAFAIAQGLEPGDRVGAVINGRRREIEIVGIGLSPEYVYSIRAGDLLPDPGRFGIFWVERRGLAAAFDMEGGFNDVAIRLAPGASEPAVTEALEDLLRPYGGLGVVPRRLQTSNWFLSNELVQLQSAGILVPAIFLLVAAFLLNVSLNRLVAVQREQIAALKAVGYSNGELGRHYIGWSLAVSLSGAALGIGVGAWLGTSMTSLYNDFFRFPQLLYRLSPAYVVLALAIGSVAGIVGALAAVGRVVRMAPAEAMRPAAPERFRQTWIERAGLRRGLSPVARMILRHTASQPVRTTLSSIGISLAVAILIVGLFFVDAIDLLLRVQFEAAQRQDVTVTFTQPVSSSAVHALGRLPGVMAVEPVRFVPVRLRHGTTTRTTAITGLPFEPALNRVLDEAQRPVAMSASGLVMSASLAEVLGVQAGDLVQVEVLEGERPIRSVRVDRLVEEFLGTSVYMAQAPLHDLLREGRPLSGAFLRVDRQRESELYETLKAVPAVAGVSLKRAAVESFRETIAQNMMTLVVFNVIFAGIIACGVVYNAARIALSERSRDLASLRVLGFTRGEVSTILLGELAVVVAIAVPLGLLVGQGLSAAILKGLESELYRFPLVITGRTRVFAVTVVIVSALLSGLLVRRRIDRLDLVAVLKTRE
jgi:putative ABC transport system permease protein